MEEKTLSKRKVSGGGVVLLRIPLVDRGQREQQEEEKVCSC